MNLKPQVPGASAVSPAKATGACTELIRAGPELYSILTFLPASQLTAGKTEGS
jgi:hypothetical protein